MRGGRGALRRRLRAADERAHMWFLKLVDVDCAAHQDWRALQSCRVSLMVLAAHLAEYRECKRIVAEVGATTATVGEMAAAWERVEAALAEAHK